MKLNFYPFGEHKIDKFCEKYVTNGSVIYTRVLELSTRVTKDTFLGLVDPLERI